MVKYHINQETGNPGLCRATKRCPFGDLTADHYASKEEARVAYEQSMSAEAKPLTLKHKAIEEMLDEALNTSLYPEISKPSWWSAMETEEEVKLPSNDAELLAIIPTPIGKIAAVSYKRSPSKTDVFPRSKAIETATTYLRDWETGEVLGYLKTSYTSDEIYKEAFGEDELSIFRFADAHKGTSLGFRDYKNNIDDITLAMTQEEKDEFKKQLWLNVYRGGDVGTPPSWRGNPEKYTPSYRMSEATIPSNPEELAQDLKEAAKNYEKRAKDLKNYWSVPLPAYAKLEKDYQGQGLGQVMYVLTARVYGIRGLPLKAASTQTPKAEALWRSIQQNKKLPTTTITTTSVDEFGKKKVNKYPALDFRKS